MASAPLKQSFGLFTHVKNIYCDMLLDISYTHVILIVFLRGTLQIFNT